MCCIRMHENGLDKQCYRDFFSQIYFKSVQRTWFHENKDSGFILWQSEANGANIWQYVKPGLVICVRNDKISQNAVYSQKNQ